MTPPVSADATVQRDTFELAAQLIEIRSITPDDGGGVTLIATRLASAGFTCERLDRNGVSNLWARFGTTAPLVCFAGHVDVVPPGPLTDWTSDPFTPTVRDGFLYGRGASDMKGPLAAMITAAERLAKAGPTRGSIAVLLTSDEEGDAVDGTAFVVATLRERGITIDACIVGEPTSSDSFGDTIKIGRRGSLSGELRAIGVQCHIAYPERGRNPIHAALPALAELATIQWDQGNDAFPPTSFQVSNIHAGAGAVNVIPGAMDISFNFRFSPESTAEGLQRRVRDTLDRHGLEYTLTWKPIAYPYATPRGALVNDLAAVITSVSEAAPVLSTSGGTSDGRFIANIAREVVEFGPVNETIHKVNERIRVDELGLLSSIYQQVFAVRLSS